MVHLHLYAVIATVLLVLFADEQAFRWFAGRTRTLSARLVAFMHWSVAFGLLIVVTTGALIFLNAPAYFLADPVFVVKLGFVAALVVNSFFIERLSRHATRQPYRALPKRCQAQLFLSAAVSLAGWLGAGTCGLILGGHL